MKDYKRTNSLLALRWIPYAVLTLTLLLTAILWQLSKVQYENKVEAKFNKDVMSVQTSIKERMHNYEYALNAILAFLKDSSDHINQKDWHEFTYILQTNAFYPGIEGIGYAAILTEDQIKTTEERLSAEYKKPVSITPKSQKDIYSVVSYLEPLQARGQTAIGFDMYTQPVLAETIQRAVDTHKVAVSGRVNLSDATANDIQPSVLMYLPLYVPERSLNTKDQRQVSARGLIYSIFRMKDLVEGIVPKEKNLDLQLYDVTDTQVKTLLYESPKDTRAIDEKHFISEFLEVGGRTWRIDFRHRVCSTSFTGQKESLMLLGFGLLFDFVLFGVLLYIAKTHRELHSSALMLDKSRRINATLSASNKAVIDSKSEEELFTNVCRYAVEYGKMNMAWIGIADQSMQKLQVKSFYGESVDYLQELDISIDPNDQTSQGPTGRAFHDKEPFWCQNFQDSSITKLWHERGVKFGWKSTAAIPLFKSGEVTGVLNLYLRERDAFDEETKKLLLEMAATISHGLDILESERQRIKVENKLEKLSQVVDQNPYPTIITDLDGIIQYSNPACRKISGYTEEELIGQKMSIFNSGIHSKEFYADLWDTLKKKKTVWKGTLVDRMKNGEQKDCYSTIFPLFDAEGNLAKFVSIKDDLTERNQKDKLFMMQTRQAQMGEMLAMIAHQWRQPLAIINAIVGKIRVEEAFSDQENHILLDRLKKIEEQSIHLSQTITEFKDFFRPDKEMEHTSFSVILSHAVNLVDHSIKTHDISFVQTLHQDPTLKTYANEILQVIITLIKNSVDAFEENKIKAPKISINIDKVGTYAMLSIEDNAGGIKPEVLDKIFLPYFTTKTTSNGTGLGLYMCKMIIEEHCGGKIEGFSDNTMATFKIFLPIEETV